MTGVRPANRERAPRPAALAAVGLAAVALAADPPSAKPADAQPFPGLEGAVAARVKRNPPLGLVPTDPTNRYADSLAAAELGQAIFSDPRFSASGTVSCATCHSPAHGFADPRPIAKGEGEGTRHAMTLLNTAYNRWFTWDGRADTLWSQALQPFETAHELNIPRQQVLQIVALDGRLAALYRAAFGADPDSTDASFARLGKAIAAFERRLVTGPSAYDRWWTRSSTGDSQADAELTAAARRGLQIFFSKGNCWQCHHGPNFTDGEFHMVGVPTRDGSAPTDPGRYAVVEGVRSNPFNAAGPHSDDPSGGQARISAALVRTPDLWGRFKTPSLRGVASRGPYMHQGQMATLADVVRFYSTLEGATALDHHQERVLAKLDLSATEQSDLVEFLRALEGTPPPAPWGDTPIAQPVAGPRDGPYPKRFTEQVKGTAISFEMVLIPGCGGRPGFYMGATEIPWELFDVFVYELDAKAGASTPEADAVTRPTKPYISMDRGFGHAGWPAISMSAHSAQKFCEWLSVKTGRAYHVPSLSQWTCAALESGIPPEGRAEYAWVAENSEGTTHKIGSRKADRAGLHDLFGNAAEWVVEPDGSSLVVGGSYRDAAAAAGPESRVPSTPDWNATDPQFPKSVWWLADGGFIGLRVVSPLPVVAPPVVAPPVTKPQP